MLLFWPGLPTNFTRDVIMKAPDADIMNHIFPYLFSRALAVNDVLIESLVYVLFVLLVVDFIHEAKYMIKNKHINKIWKVDIKEKYIVNHDQVRYIH